MKEKKVWESLRRLLPQDMHYERIESITGAGIPDFNGCLNGVEFWAELKVLVGVKRLRFQCPLKPLQIQWLTQRARAGGRSFVIARHEDTWYIWKGHKARALSLGSPLETSPDLILPKPWKKDLLLFALVRS